VKKTGQPRETWRCLFGFGVAAVALALDQASKVWAIGLLDGPEHPAFELAPFLALTMSWNRGIAYTMLPANSDVGRYALVAVALGAAIFLGGWLWRASGLVKTAALGLLIGGALGNALDRLIHGAVADFLYFHTPVSLGPLSNYVFNIADAAIFVGVLLLLYESFAAPDAAAKVKADIQG
jgi:signal peptidase II